MLFDMLRWWLTVEVVGLLATPLTLTIFRRLPDLGYSFSKPLGILLVSHAAWLLAMFGLSSFSLPVLVSTALMVGLAGLYAARRARLDVRHSLQALVPAIALEKVLFVLFLYIGLVLRWRGIWGAQINHTEKPMDFAFLNGILASTQFPPQDPWLAHYPINYYYFGYVMMAALTRLSGLASGVAFNLAGATIYALTATAVAGIVWNLIGLDRRNAGETESAPARARLGRLGQLGASIVAATLVLVAGNQVAPLQWLAQSERVVALRGAEVFAALRAPRQDGQLTLPGPLPPNRGVEEWSDLRTLPLAPTRRAAVSSWWASRAVWDDLRDGAGQVFRNYTITEFPFFSFLLGDLHPHVLSLPWTLLAVALSLNLLTRQAAPEWIRGSLGRIELWVTAVALGGLYAINSWDLPTYLLLFAGSLLLLYRRMARGAGHLFWAHLIQQAGVLLVACWVVWLPFHMTFVSLVGGNGFPLGLSPVRTPLMQFVVMFGLFAVPLLAMVLREAARRSGPRVPVLPVALIGLGLVVAGIAVRFPLFFLLPLALGAIVLADRAVDSPARSFALWAAALAALVVFGTEIVYLRDVFQGSSPRMNTLFKFYYQVWLLWGTLAGYALWTLLRRPRPWSALWLAPFAALLVGATLYPFFTPARGSVDRTLDGVAYLERDRRGDAAGIAWIKENTPGDAVVLQAPTRGSYQPDFATISTVTGRPTLIGWQGHENQWRGGQPEVMEVLEARVNDATRIYVTTDDEEARELIEEHDIDYVYVGPIEQRFAEEQGAPAEALTKFSAFMDLAWSGEGVSIYRRR